MKDHFNPLREPWIDSVKTCPYCQSATIKVENTPSVRKFFCFRCGKVWEDKKNET